MKFAFSTVACPAWDFDTVARSAREFGYDGVEIRTHSDESALAASNASLTDPAKLRALFAYYRVEIACLSTSISFAKSPKIDAGRGAELRGHVDGAAALGCPFVKLFDASVRPGQSHSTVAVAMGRWLRPLADYAGERGVTLLVENALSFRHARHLWELIEQVGSPSVAVCWDVLSAALAGENPATSIPTLNGRIQCVHLKDAGLESGGASFRTLGEGDLGLPRLINRLRGIGYKGYLTLDWEKAWLPALAGPEVVLPESIQKLREWTRPQVDPKAEKKAPPKPVAVK